MYNRYIPQSDGTYRKRPVQEQAKAKAPIPSPPPQPHPKSEPAAGFLRQLLPKEFDTGDLLIVLLLLLMAGDSKDEKNTALLTLALYFFM